jgi:hypothetical protein
VTTAPARRPRPTSERTRGPAAYTRTRCRRVRCHADELSPVLGRRQSAFNQIELLRRSPESVSPRSPDGWRMSPVPATVPGDALLRTKYFQDDYSSFLLLMGLGQRRLRRQRPDRGMDAAFRPTITLGRGEAARSVLADSSGSTGADSSLSTRSRTPGPASGTLLCQPLPQPSSSHA